MILDDSDKKNQDMHQAVLHLLSSLRSSSCVGYSEVNRFRGDEQSLASPLWKMMKIWNDACQAGMDIVSPRIRLSLHVLGSEIWTSWSHSQFLQLEIKTVWRVWDSRDISVHLFENGLSTSFNSPHAFYLRIFGDLPPCMKPTSLVCRCACGHENGEAETQHMTFHCELNWSLSWLDWLVYWLIISLKKNWLHVFCKTRGLSA